MTPNRAFESREWSEENLIKAVSAVQNGMLLTNTTAKW
jgi:hypothetical protein